MRTMTKKHEEEGHISRLLNMLRPMSLSSFFNTLTSIMTTGRFEIFPLGKISEISLKPEDKKPGEGVQNGQENPPWMFCPSTYYMRCFFFLYSTAYTVH